MHPSGAEIQRLVSGWRNGPILKGATSLVYIQGNRAQRAARHASSGQDEPSLDGTYAYWAVDWTRKQANLFESLNTCPGVLPNRTALGWHYEGNGVEHRAGTDQHRSVVASMVES